MKPASAWAILLLLVLSVFIWGPVASGQASSNATGANNDDVTALLEFKASFTNGGEVLISWNGSDPCTGWAGVTCDSSGRVVEL
jgi:hypothetical protein